jgi:CxxC-x17-CxxC domain-containing protein
MGDGALRARGNSDGVGAGGDHAPRPYGERPAPDAAGGRRQVFDAPRARRPKRPREVASASPPVADASSAPAKSKKSKNGKKGGAKFDVTCVECGAAAQVPFKPIEGRDIYCQPCYQARRLVAPAPKTDPMLEVAAPPAEVDAVEEGSTRRTPERA